MPKPTESDELAQDNRKQSKPTEPDELAQDNRKQPKPTEPDELAQDNRKQPKPTKSDELAQDNCKQLKPTEPDELAQDNSEHDDFIQVEITFQISFGRLTRFLLEELEIFDNSVPRVTATNRETRFNIDFRRDCWKEVTKTLSRFGVGWAMPTFGRASKLENPNHSIMWVSLPRGRVFEQSPIDFSNLKNLCRFLTKSSVHVTCFLCFLVCVAHLENFAEVDCLSFCTVMESKRPV